MVPKEGSEIEFLVDRGISLEMLLAGARRVQDQCQVGPITTAASIAREIFLAMRNNEILDVRKGDEALGNKKENVQKKERKKRKNG